jgi:NAD(P)-dependent dehydrogenase (short-subunit alcohol dehydrogenase family)
MKSAGREFDGMSVVLISGANSGIGYEAALAFARAGHRVMAGSRSPARAEHLVKLAADESLPLQVVQLDVTRDDSVSTAVRITNETWGPVDILINNAAISVVGAVEVQPEQVVRDTFETNFFGPLRLIRAVLPSMRARRQGTIILVGSLNGRIPAPNSGVYAASKQAAAAMSDALAIEVEGLGIRVGCVEIGPYRTGMVNAARVADDPAPPDYAPLLDALRARTRQRMADSGDPAEVAAAIMAMAASSSPPLRQPVGRHAQTWLAEDQIGERFRQGLRRELGLQDPSFPAPSVG